jgi:type 1 fimbria pilin
MKMAGKHLIGVLLAAAVWSAAQGKQTFTGTITDDECTRADHSRMRMGPTDAECVLACVAAHSARFVFYDGKDVFDLSDQQKPEQFAGQKVTVTGTLDARTKIIQVDSITTAK